LSRKVKPKLASAFGNEEKLYLVKAILLIVGIYVFQDFIYDYWKYLALFLPGFFIMYLWFMSIYTGDRFYDLLKEQITLMPIPYAEGGKKVFIPLATIVLILANVLIYYIFQKPSITNNEFIAANFTFLPDTVTWWNLLISPFSSMFLHADAGHLWGNMFFLWAFGPAVEERLGAKKFVSLYLITGFLGDSIALFVKFFILSKSYHAWGASGAISGTMGVFMIRCYFKKLVIPIPLLGLVNLKLRINSLLPLGFFFLRDLSGGFKQLVGSNSRIGYWAHVGSMVVGIILAARLKLHRDAAEEKYTEDGIAGVEDQVYGIDGEGQLLKALALNPKNETALLAMARLKARKRLRQGMELFQQVIYLALRSDPKRAAKIYIEYFSIYKRMLEPDLEYRLSGIFYSQGENKKAIRSLEMVVDEPSTKEATRERAFFQLISVLAENRQIEGAQFRLRQFGETFPQSTLLQRAREISNKDSKRTVNKT